MARYTQKQIDKYNRQKYLGELEKVSKNLFRMFRDKNISAEEFVEKFKALKERLEGREVPSYLDSEYHNALKSYIERLYDQCCSDDTFGDSDLSDIREAEMSNLNRLQKMKNGVSYKKEKHKAKHHHEDWGG
jgi:hypothetical protein